jgi:transcriptional regulator with XRE-family HTH domain
MEECVAGSFSAQLRWHRTSACLTQEELAERAGLSVRAIMYLERGSRTPQLPTVRLLASALGLSPVEQAALAATITPPWRFPSPRIFDSAAYNAVAHSLLAPTLTPLFGRDLVLESLTAVLQRPAVRLLTLTGTGGVGKTRLALALATFAVRSRSVTCSGR